MRNRYTGETQRRQVRYSIFIGVHNIGTGRKVCRGLERVAQVHDYEHDNWINPLRKSSQQGFMG
jgi:hypothetical protein